MTEESLPFWGKGAISPRVAPHTAVEKETVNTRPTPFLQAVPRISHFRISPASLQDVACFPFYAIELRETNLCSPFGSAIAGAIAGS